MPHEVDTTCLSCGTTNPLGSVNCRVCGAPLEETVFLPNGSRVGSYELLSVLGRGGFGITYKAKDAATGEIVALKELFPDGMATRDSSGDVRIPTASLEEFEKLKSRFAVEGQLLQSITNRASSHFIALFAQHETLYLAMEFVAGETLEARLARGAKFTMKEARSALRDVLGVLQEAHSAGLLHRDIKPANIILTPNGAELIDFGSGVRFQQNRTMQVSQRVLTPEYAPLEFYGQNVRLSSASDLYSVAATFYEAVSGVRPPSALDRANGASLEGLGTLRPDISQNFADTIDAALALRVDARPQSAQAMLAALNKPSPASRRAASPRAAPPKPSASNAAVQTGGDPDHWTLLALLGWWTALSLFATLFSLGGDGFGLVFFGGLLAFAGLSVGALLIAPLRWVLARFFGVARPIGLYRQAMLGLYSFGGAFLLRTLFPNPHGLWDDLGLPVLIGSIFALLGLIGSTAPSARRPLWQPVLAGLGIFIAFALFAPSALLRFQSLTAPPTSSQSASPSPSSGVPQVTPPSSATFSNLTTAPFANLAITGNKWVCQQQRGKPFEETMLGGAFLIALDDESHAVAEALAPRLNAKALPCSDVANRVTKFTNLDVSLRKDRAKAGEMIWQFVPYLETSLAVSGHWLSTKASIVLLTSKPIEGTVEFLERVSYVGRQHLMLVSTAGLKPKDYQSAPAGRNTLLERVVALIQHQQTQNSTTLESLEALDALWNPGVVTPAVNASPQALFKRLPKSGTVLKLEKTYGGSVLVGAFSPNGRFAVTASPGGSVRVSETATGRQRAVFDVAGGIAELAISPGARFVAAATGRRGVVIRDLERAEFLSDEPINAVASSEVQFSSDGRYLLLARTVKAASSLELLSVAALRNGKREVLLRLEPRIGEIHASAFNADASYLTLGGSQGELRVYALQKLFAQAARGERVQGALPLKSHAATISDLAFSPDGRWMASADSGSEDTARVVRLWDVRRGFRLVKELLWGVAVAFSPDSKQLVFSSADSYRTVKILNLERPTRNAREVGNISNPMFALCFSGAGRAVGISGAGIHLLNTKGNRETETIFHATGSIGQLELDANGGVLWATQYNSDDLGRLTLKNGQYAVERLKAANNSDHLEPQRVSVTGSGQVFVSTTDDALVTLRAGQTAVLTDTTGGETVSVSRSGRWAISTAPSDVLYDLRRGSTQHLREKQALYMNAAAFTAQENRAVTLNADESFTSWNLETAKPLRRFGNRDGIPRRAQYTHLRASSDGRFFAAGRKNGIITLWDAKTGKRLTDWRELEDATYGECCYGTTSDLRFSADGGFVLAATDQGAAIFDTKTLRAVARFEANPATVTAFAVDPSGKRIYTASSDGVIRQLAWR